MMQRLPLKPMSVNAAYTTPKKAKRFKSPAYKAFIRDVGILLKKMDIPDGELELVLNWGLSNYGGSDWDNPIKPFQDCLQKHLGFNDNRVKRGIVEKFRVKKGDEYIEFELRAMPC